MLLNPSQDPSRFAQIEAFNEEDVKKVRFFERISGGNKEEVAYTSCTVMTIQQDQNTDQVVYSRMNGLMSLVNYDHFIYDIESLEPCRFMIFSETDSYEPHRDINLTGYRPVDRRITCITMLSNADEYTGGEIWIDINGNYEPIKVELKAGEALYFDSHVTWEIKPIESGELRIMTTYGWGQLQIGG